MLLNEQLNQSTAHFTHRKKSKELRLSGLIALAIFPRDLLLQLHLERSRRR